MLVLSGDITDHGDRGASTDRRVARRLPVPGLADGRQPRHREGLLHAFPQVARRRRVPALRDRAGRLRIVLLDTVEPGRHGGAFCEARRRWLRRGSTEAPATPTLMFMHHPPVVSGIDWMDPDPDEAWVAASAPRSRRPATGARDPLRPPAPPAGGELPRDPARTSPPRSRRWWRWTCARSTRTGPTSAS